MVTEAIGREDQVTQGQSWRQDPREHHKLRDKHQRKGLNRELRGSSSTGRGWCGNKKVMDGGKCFAKMVLGRDREKCIECGNWEASGDTGLRSERYKHQTAVS